MNSIFTEENLLAFTTAARFGSFSKAAEELGLTTSAISYTIKRMETGLDVVLFTRSTRSIELTESGRYFFRKATDLLNDFYAIKRSIDTISQGIEARVRICINQLLYTPKHTARLLQVLKKQFPTCQITVTTEVYNGVWDAIINNQANIAIGAPDTLLDGGGIDYTEIGAIRWAFAIAPDHPLAFVPEPIAESQLRLYPNIMVEDTAHTINKKVGWLLHGQESILVPVKHLLPDNFHIGINVSAGCFLAAGFEKECLNLVKKLGNDKIKLVLELTERNPIPVTPEARAIFDSLHQHNITFALDDFGTGYATYRYLQAFPVDFIKIDKSFVQMASVDEISGHIVDNIVELARKPGLSIVAEGVETQEQADLMIGKGVHFLQGYLYSPPVPGNKFISEWVMKAGG